MNDSPRLTVRAYAPGDETAILSAFNEVFARTDPDFVPRTMAEWRWLFGNHPYGQRIWLGWDADGHVIGQQASTPLRMRVDGEEMYWSHVVDSFADQRRSRGLKKPGVYATTARAHSDNCGGEPPERDPIMFGFPVRAAWRIGKLYLDYEIARSQDALAVPLDRVPPADAAASAATEGVTTERLLSLGPDVDALFEETAPHYRAIAVRDSVYLDWRYLAHPKHQYSIGAARRANRLVGLAVYRHATFHGRNAGLICDWVVPPSDREATAALHAWLADRAREDGATELFGIWPDTCPEWTTFQEMGFRVVPTDYFNVICRYTRRFDTRWLYWHWYYTLGDTDLC